MVVELNDDKRPHRMVNSLVVLPDTGKLDGTISFYDGDGEFLRTVRMGCMPETKKKTLKRMLSSELGQVFAQRPELTLVAIADGANDNWSYLQTEVLDLLSDDHP